ncbi:UPF0426 protein At1g28150, chloroplastic [Magnolia sinica]|uniref:UPF0426 protein At1g28150, chloroplastic n=1 Tax=Magnolia sinica TaxID=86752 RepID=UPI002659E284|nr:UPF0426 protein At1g28150, chloroplastic [Magnolia sinica]
MALFTTSSTMWKPTHFTVFSPPKREIKSFRAFRAKAFFNPIDEPIVKEALKEPVAFMSGMFAGLLRLDLNEDPLKEWLTRTVEASGITKEEIDVESSKVEEDAPQEIQIE